MAMEDEVCTDTPPHDDLCVEWNERSSQHYLNIQGFDTCICNTIRACEQRVLDAAKQSVASIPYTEIDGYPFVIRAEALAAIRGLREEK